MLSLLLNVHTVHADPGAAFYSPQTRFWEMLAGSALAYLTLHQKDIFSVAQKRLDGWLGRVIYTQAPPADGRTLRDVKALVGIALIVIGFWLITKERAFPGWWALMPTGGAILIITAGSQAWLNRIVLAHRTLVWFGLISFPLYLWHWPLLAFARVMERGTPSAAVRAGAVLAAVVLAWLSYALVEKHVRSGRHNRMKTLVLAGLMITVCLAGFETHRRDGFPARAKDRQEFEAYFENSLPGWNYFVRAGIPEKVHHECEFYDIESLRAGKNTSVPRASIAPHCYQRDPAKPHVVMLWGDSHAEHLSYGIRQQLPATWQVLQIATSACAPFLYMAGPSTTDQCVHSNWFAQKVIAEVKPDVVIIAQNTGHTVERFHQFSAELKQLGVKKVIYAGPSPHWTAELPSLVLSKFWNKTPRRTYDGIDRAVLDANAALRAGYKPTGSDMYVDLISLFCNKEGCLTYLGEDRKAGITSYDYGHLTPAASEFLAKQLLVQAIIGAPAP